MSLSSRPLALCRHDRGWWFRLFGFGITCYDIRREGLLWSVRHGYATALIAHGRCYRLLVPWRTP